jgi:hypothetical protein
MDVMINEMHSTIEFGADQALLEPATLRLIVAAVRRDLDEREGAQRWEARERAVTPTGNLGGGR